MDSWLNLTEAEFSTWHTLNPRGLCLWILLDKIHPGESCQSKEQRSLCSQQEWRDAVLQALTAPLSVFSPQEVLADLRGSRTPTQPEQSSKAAPLSWWQHPVQLLPHLPERFCGPSASHQPFPGGVKYHQNAYCSCCPSESIPIKFMMMSKYIALILWLGKWRWRELQCFNNLWNGGLLMAIPLTLENPRSIKGSPNHWAVLHFTCFQSCLKSSRSYLLSESCCIFLISTVPHQEKPIEKYTSAHKKLI